MRSLIISSMPNIELRGYWTYQDLMRLFRRSYMTIYVWKTKRGLPHIQIGPKRVLFPKQPVRDWAASQKIELHYDDPSGSERQSKSPIPPPNSALRSDASPLTA